MVVGFTAPSGRRHDLGALLLAARSDDGLRYAGKVGTGSDADALAAVRRRLERCARRTRRSPTRRGRRA